MAQRGDISRAHIDLPGATLMRSPSVAQFEQANTGQRSRPFLLMGGVAALLTTGYAFGYLRLIGALEQAIHSFQMSGTIAPAPAICTIAAAVALLLFALLPRSTDLVFWRRSPLAGRPEKAIAQFVEEAKQARISLRVAREGYDLLRHHYPQPMCVDLNDELCRDLRMNSKEIVSVRAGLLGRTDRLEQEGQGDADHTRLTTVRQLLESVEAAAKNGVDRTTMRQRVTDLPFYPRPVVENLEFTEESSLADPDYLRRAHFKWVRRRDTDYKGFRSRAGDDGQGKTHAGPFRRATELSRRLAIRQEAGRRAKLAEELAAERGHRDAQRPVGLDARDPPTQQTAHQGY